MVGIDVTSGVLKSLNSAMFPNSLNHTNIIHIPKKKNPEVVANYRLISLCNILYKVVEKVLANQMKGILPNVISSTQSAFVLGCLIMDNILIAYEVIMHYLNKWKKAMNDHMSLKLEMSKAYDRVEWSFLEMMMRKMTF